jgi:hypothetical protein
MSLGELAALDAQKKAAKDAADEAERKAKEEANRYDPANFTVVPSEFKPATYSKVDLFDAVAHAERMLRGNGSWGDSLFTTSKFVSDVVFVDQNGTDIQFRTADGAISQYMKISSRSGLTAGQKVRLYYIVTKNPSTVWTVVAIERL